SEHRTERQKDGGQGETEVPHLESTQIHEGFVLFAKLVLSQSKDEKCDGANDDREDTYGTFALQDCSEGTEAVHQTTEGKHRKDDRQNIQWSDLGFANVLDQEETNHQSDNNDRKHHPEQPVPGQRVKNDTR